jgi:sigma-54 dependent transcriptional regulator, acetoin dehydrogenase operon transcriptional activator AcoR
VDVRIIAATNKKLKYEIQQGTFREDLFFRLNVISIEMPPLRERKSDIPALTKHFIEEISLENQLPPVFPNEEGMEVLINYDWLGNIRELRNILEWMMLFCQAPDTPTELIKNNLGDKSKIDVPGSETETVNEVEKELLIRTLNKERGNISRAAKSLAISRNSIYRKMKKYNIIPADSIGIVWNSL